MVYHGRIPYGSKSVTWSVLAIPKYTLSGFTDAGTVLEQCICKLCLQINIDPLGSMLIWFYSCLAFCLERCFLLICLLWEQIMLEIFSAQQQLTFTIFLLNILWSLLDFGRWWSSNLRKRFATLVMKFWVYGGLNQMMFRLLLCFDLFSIVCV